MANYHNIIASPVGDLTLIASERGLMAVLWENEDPARVKIDAGTRADDYPMLRETEKQLREYFAGDRTAFTLLLDFQGTEFQQQVWQALLTIPYGETRSYLQIARYINNEKSVRAVGAANGKNPISIIAPCHRVIGASGKLTGFAGGLEAKAFLLRLESKRHSTSAEYQPDFWA